MTNVNNDEVNLPQAGSNVNSDEKNFDMKSLDDALPQSSKLQESVKMFGVVFHNQSLKVVPMRWLKGDSCSWPTKEPSEEDIKKSEKPGKDWTPCKVDIMSVNLDTYDEASQSLSKYTAVPVSSETPDVDGGLSVSSDNFETESEDSVLADTCKKMLPKIDKKMNALCVKFGIKIDAIHITINLPLETKADLDLLENYLKSDKVQDYLREKLSDIEVTDFARTVGKMLTKLMTNKLAMRFTWAGTKKKGKIVKYSFSHLENIKSTLFQNLPQHNLKHREIYLLYVLNPGMAIVGEVNTTDQSYFFIKWTIENFFSLSSEVEKYYSPSFPFGGADWRLKMWPYGQKEKKSEGHIDLYLIRCTPGPPIDMKYAFCLEKLNKKTHTFQYLEFTFEQKLHFHGSLRLVSRSKLLERKSKFSSSGRLTWICQIIVPKDVSSDNSASAGKDKFLEQLKHPFLNHQNCDVVLRVQGRDFQAHQTILTAHSHVFASLFQNHTKEKATAIVDIGGCSPSIFSDFLYFLYCQETDRLSKENVLSLLAVADKYGVSELRTKCLEFIKEKISAHTFGDTLASFHSETESIQLAAA